MSEGFDERRGADADHLLEMVEPVLLPQGEALSLPPINPAATPLPSRRARLVSHYQGATPNLRGSAMMVLALAFFAIMMTLIKLVGARITMPQILVIRQLVMTVMLVMVVGPNLPGAMRTARPGLQITRGLLSLGAMLCGFTAIVYLPMAVATSLGFSQVFFVTILAIIVLHEVVDWQRWVALAIGFCGVLVILRPSTDGMNLYALLALTGAMFGAGITVAVRILGAQERTETILFWQGAVVLLALGLPALLWWVPPTPTEWIWLIGIGVVGTAGQWFITRAYQLGEASALAPLDFVRLVLATTSGYLVFAEVPDLVTIFGACLVVVGTLYTMKRNSRRKAVISTPVD